MGDLNSVLITVCGFGVVCCGSLVVGVLLLMRVTGRALLLPVFSTLGGMIFGSGGGGYDTDYTPRQRRASADQFRARAQTQSGGLDFDQAVARYQQQAGASPQLSSGQDTTGSQPISDQSTQLNPPDPPSLRGGSPYGVRTASHSPGRRLRDGRFDRNRGPSRIPDEFHEGLVPPDSDLQLPGEDIFGPEAPPGLRSSYRRRPRRDVRRRDRRDRNMDEVFGGMLDESGDGYPDS
jgi:hypothetical protein